MNCNWDHFDVFCPFFHRPCAMVVPDFELICEIMLVAEGFLDARVLARKFITLYTLCKELLSKQVISVFFDVTHLIWLERARSISTSKLNKWHNVLFIFEAFDKGMTQRHHTRADFQTELSEWSATLHMNKKLQGVWMLFHLKFPLILF